jgi:hypothetical protein
MSTDELYVQRTTVNIEHIRQQIQLEVITQQRFEQGNLERRYINNSIVLYCIVLYSIDLRNSAFII